jgi:hypothetical protein
MFQDLIRSSKLIINCLSILAVSYLNLQVTEEFLILYCGRLCSIEVKQGHSTEGS